MNKDYFMYFLRLNFSNLNTDIKGAAIPHLKQDKMLYLEIRIQDIAEQQKIVSEIEKQFTRLDASVKDLKSVKEKLEVYRKSVLKSAFEGNLINTRVKDD